MRDVSFIFTWLLFTAVTCATPAAEPAANNPAPIRYQKEVAPVVSEAMAGFPAVMERFGKGLPKGSELHVTIRLLDEMDLITPPEVMVARLKDGVAGADWIELADVRVSKFDPVNREITGKITNELPRNTGRARGDKISTSVINLVDWKIIHRDGSAEGGIFAKFLAGKGAGVDLSQLLIDEEVAGKRELLTSPELVQAIGRSYLQLFDDPELRIDYESKTNPFVGAWPELGKKYAKVPAEDLLTGLRARAETLKPALRFKISEPPSVDKTSKRGHIDGVFYGVDAYVVMKRKGFVFEVRQLLHFFYRDGVLEHVRWGDKIARPIKLKSTAG